MSSSGASDREVLRVCDDAAVNDRPAAFRVRRALPARPIAGANAWTLASGMPASRAARVGW